MDERRRRFEAQTLPHLGAAHNLARWLSRSPTDAEDIVQEAFLRAYRGFDGLQGAEAKPWLLAIVRNCWRDLAAKGGRRAETPLTDETAAILAADAVDPEASAVAASEGRRLDAVIATLPAEFREVLILREMEDLSYRQIADAVGAPIGTVMSRLARARALVKQGWLAEVHS